MTRVEISPFLDRKLSRRFQTFDDNRDGQIARLDFQNSANRLADTFGHGPDAPERTRLLEVTAALFERLVTAADTNGSGTITEDEYKRAFAAGLLVTEETFEAGYRPFLQAVLAVVDSDGDGRITVSQHVRFTGSLLRLPEPVARDTHHRLDTDDDGYISADDLLAAIHDFYFDDDPDGVGSWLLGPLESNGHP